MVLKCSNIIILILAICLVLPMGIAQTNLGVLKQNSCITLMQTCADCTYNTITSVTSPTSKVAMGLSSMTRIGTEYNATFCNTTEIGEYIVNGFGDLDGADTIWNYNFEITPTGEDISNIQIVIYLFFLIICIGLLVVSVYLIKKNKVSQDISGQEKYNLKKRNEFLFYLALLKRKLWIAGVFGIYLSILMFMGVLNQTTYILGIGDLQRIIDYIFIVLAWGLIPFIIFWIIWLIIFFLTSAKDILKYQFGSFGEEKR